MIDFEQVVIVCLLTVAPIVGSFIGLLLDRLPNNEPVVFSRSRCRSCGRNLGWFDLVPIVSFVQSCGKCRRCGASIPRELLLIELGALGCTVLAAVLADSVFWLGLTTLFLWLMLALSLFDLRYFLLPDALTVALALTGLVAISSLHHISWQDAIIGMLVGSGAFYLLRVGFFYLRGREGIGLGDVKLMAGLGVWFGWQPLPIIILTASLLAILAAPLFSGGADMRMFRHVKLPFGAFLCAAAAGIWLVQR